MITYHLALSEQTDTVVRMLAELNTADPVIAAATLRAVADQLDPPKPPRPTFREALDDYRLRSDTPAVLRTDPVEPWMRRQAADPPGVRIMSGPLAGMFERHAADGSRKITGERCEGDACSERHTYRPGCQLEVPTPLPVPDLGVDRADVLGTAVAEAVDRVAADTLERARRMEPVREHTPGCESIHTQGTPCLPPRRTRITPDGCGPEHTFTGSCALAPNHRD